ncbi:hypothetical protein NXY46_25155 [Bacteroides ovatus]|nr:hypothetical protein [Bacteroides ovatus]
MQENKRNKETSLFKKPQGFRTVRIHFTAEAIEWLGGTTKDDDGNTIGNHTLFMTCSHGCDCPPAGAIHSAGRRNCSPDSSSSRKPDSRRNGT